MMYRSVVVACLGLFACAKRVATIPRESTLSLAGQSAIYRPWQQVEDLCLVPEEQFVGEQQALTRVLAEWLGKTSAPVDGAWDEEHLGLLEEGARVLPPIITAQRDALTRAKRCRFNGLSAPRELLDQADRRATEAADTAPLIRARLALAQWKDVRPVAQATAFDENCRLKAAPKAPVLYYAAEDETARLEWLFCDGSKVVASVGNPPAWEANPNAKKSKKQPDAQQYLGIAAAYPSEKISRAPKPPKKKKSDDDFSLEPKDDAP